MITPQQAADKWASRLSASTQAIKDGVQAVTVSPTHKAAASLDRYIQGVVNAVNSGRMAARLNAVPLSSWQQAMTGKGISRIPQGASDAKPKMVAFMSKWLPYEAQLQQVLSGMPRGDLNQNIARAVAAIQHNAAFKGTTY